MTHWDDDDEDWADDEADDDDGDTRSAAEDPDPADLRPSADDSADDDTVPCPFCRRRVYEDADVCPGCGNFVGGSDEPAGRRRPLWVLVAAALCLLAMGVACLTRMW